MTLSTEPTPSSNQPAPVPKGQFTGLYSKPEEALKTLTEDYSYWTSKLTESSFAVSLAVIGANWAVFRSVDKILENSWATWSITVVGLSLVVSLIGSYRLGELVHRQIAYAEGNLTEWQKEFDANIGKSTPWPLTQGIERLAWILRLVKMLLPIAGVVLFLFALFSQPRTQKNQSHSDSSALATPFALSSPPETTAQPLTSTPTPTATPAATPTATPTPSLAVQTSRDSSASPTPSR